MGALEGGHQDHWTISNDSGDTSAHLPCSDQTSLPLHPTLENEPLTQIETECDLLGRACSAAHSAYRPLQKGHIRLFKILAGDTDAKISIDLGVFSQADSPHYTAISYAWGSPHASWEVAVNGTTLLVPTNLHRFLGQARSSARKFGGWIWVDMLSIDQTNLQERAEQVIMMPEIFQGASQVVVWLGPAYKHSDDAMDVLSKPSSHWNRKHRLQFWANSAGLGFLELCQRMYWRRLWVFQELRLANEKQLMCGSKIISWRKIKDFMVLADKATDVHRQDDRTLLIKNTSAMKMVKFTMAPADVTLWALMRMTKHLQCADIRDRSYALLGVIAEEQPGGKIPEMTPDYSLPVSAFLNAVLRQVYALHPPKDLQEAQERCEEVEAALNVHPGTIYTLHDKRGLCKDVFNVESPSYRLGPRSLRLSLWWAHFYGHTVILRLLVRSWSHDYWQSTMSSQRQSDIGSETSERIAVHQLLSDAYMVGSNDRSSTMTTDDVACSVLDMLFNPKRTQEPTASTSTKIYVISHPAEEHQSAKNMTTTIADTLYRAILENDIRVAELFLAHGGCIASFNDRLSAALLNLTLNGPSDHKKEELLESGRPEGCYLTLKATYGFKLQDPRICQAMSIPMYAILTKAHGAVLAIIESRRWDVSRLVPTEIGPSRYYLTALHAAVYSESDELTRMLLEVGHANIHIRSKSKRSDEYENLTPIEIAREMITSAENGLSDVMREDGLILYPRVFYHGKSPDRFQQIKNNYLAIEQLLLQAETRQLLHELPRL